MNYPYPWQRTQWQRLLSEHRQNRLPHALLLAGPAGLGKEAFARQFGHFLLCTQQDNGQEGACGQCSGCRLLAVNNHPDLFIISPEESGKAIKVDQIRQLTASVNQTAQRGGYQVVVICPAEALNKAAANALLKTLEEPAGAVVLLLVSHQPGAIPATILSRCQRITFTGQEHPDQIDWLKTQLQAAEINADALLLLKIAEYAPLRALALAQNQYLALRDQLLKHLIAISRQQVHPLAPVTEFLKLDLNLWLLAFISLVLDMARLQLNTQARLVNSDRLAPLQQLNQTYPVQGLMTFLAQLNQARQWIVDGGIHLNVQLLLENLLIEWERGGNGVR